MAAEAKKTDEPKKTSMVVQLGLLAGLTVAALGSGWLAGNYLHGGLGEPKPASAGAQPSYDEEPGSDLMAEALNIFRLEDITTSLAGSNDFWVRMQVALVFTEQPDPMLAEAIHQDFLAYLRTVRVPQIEGPSGFRHLKQDLEERAALRSDGKVAQILFRTLLFE